jgi:hypothetical protein
MARSSALSFSLVVLVGCAQVTWGDQASAIAQYTLNRLCEAPPQGLLNILNTPERQAALHLICEQATR